MWTSSCGNWGSTVVRFHHAHRTRRTARYMSSLVFHFRSRLQSTFEFPRRVSSCPRGSCSLPLPCLTGISETPTRRTYAFQPSVQISRPCTRWQHRRTCWRRRSARWRSRFTLTIPASHNRLVASMAMPIQITSFLPLARISSACT
jgi:hypothetical protein